MSGDDGLREAIARALVASDANVHGSYTWDECDDELRDDYRRYADAVLALPELVALRAKADAADRVRALADELIAVGKRVGPIQASALRYAADEIRAALDGPPSC